MIMSFSFSAALYSLSMREFERGFRRQNEIINELPPYNSIYPNFQQRFTESRQTAAREARARILSQLIFANVVVLISGGGLSYFLARRTLEPIEEAHQSLEQFTADASHELRTPIAAMKSEIEVALLQPRLTGGDVKDVLHSNLEELDRLTFLTDSLLALARHEQKPLELKNQPIFSVIDTAVRQLKKAANEKNVTISSDISKKIRATFDKHAMEEVIVILLDNAIKYSNNNDSVEVRVYAKKAGTTISVTDHGTGIKQEDIGNVFKRFYRADNSRAQTKKGHGLGLSIAKQLVESQQGSIKITSTPDKVTTATVVLPS
jgi:two-component system sensor histidine kinase CiaH